MYFNLYNIAVPVQQPSKAPLTGHNDTVTQVPVMGCFPGMDTSQCPMDGCQGGLVCDGIKCVRPTECTCIIEGRIVRVITFMFCCQFLQ